MKLALDSLFERRIINRGRNYYDEKRIRYVIKNGDVLHALVDGSFEYTVRVDMVSGTIRCNCPYDENCKHGAAVIIAYNNKQYIDGTAIRDFLGSLEKEKLVDMVFGNLLKDHRSMASLIRRVETKERPNEREENEPGGKEEPRAELYEGLFTSFDTYDFPREFVDAVYAVANSNIPTMLEFLSEVIAYQEDIVCTFPEDYAYDSRYVQSDHPSENDIYDALGSLMDAFFSLGPEDEELEELIDLRDDDEYMMIECAEAVLKHREQVPEHYALQLLDNAHFVKYLLELGKTKKALRVCESPLQKFTLLTEHEPENALEFGLTKLVPGHANVLAEYMIDSGKSDDECLDVLLRGTNPSFDILCRLEDAVLENKYLVYENLSRKKQYETYYLLCKRFEDPEPLKKLVDARLDDNLAVYVGAYLIGSKIPEGIDLLEKCLFKIMRKNYSGYMADVQHIFEIIALANKGRAQAIYDKIDKKYPKRTKLKHGLRKSL